MSTVAFGQLEPEHLPTRHQFSFPYSLALLSRQKNGDVYVWTGGSAPDAVDRSFKWMSVTKLLVAVSFWVQSLPGSGYQGIVLPLDTPAGPPLDSRVVLQDLLSHSSGVPFDAPSSTDGQARDSRMGVRFGVAHPEQSLRPPFTKRIYSNYGFELAGGLAREALGLEWADWVRRAILEPLGMRSTKLAGSPAWGATGPIVDLAKLAAELLSPRVLGLTESDLLRFTAPQHPGLRGVLPGYGFHKDNLWATGVELHGVKVPHYLPASFPPEVFGHFGQSGSLVWIDRAAGVAGAFLGTQKFGPMHKALWPSLNTEIRQLALLAQQ